MRGSYSLCIRDHNDRDSFLEDGEEMTCTLRMILDCPIQEGEWYATTRPDAIAHIYDRNGGRLFDTTHHGKMREDAQHIAAFNPKVCLEMIAEIRKTRKAYAELEEVRKQYSKAFAEIVNDALYVWTLP